MFRRMRSSRMGLGAALLVWLSFALMLVVQPTAAWALTIDINQFSLYFWSPAVNTAINGSSTLQQDLIIGPNNLSGGPYTDFISQGFIVNVTNTLNSNNLGSISIIIGNPTTTAFAPGTLIALLDADIVSTPGGTDNNLDSSGPSFLPPGANAFQVDNQMTGSILGNILAGTLDNTDYIGAGPDDVSLALLYSLSGGLGANQQISAGFVFSDFENGGLHQFRDDTQLFFNGGAFLSNLDPNLTNNYPGQPTPEPGTLILLGTGAGLTALGRLRRRFRKGGAVKGAALGMLVFALLTLSFAGASYAQTPSLPDLSPVVGDPRLQPIPSTPIRLVNISVLGSRQGVLQSEMLTMRFLPRVNGQNMSDGDKHADMYVLYNAATGQKINQRPVVEAVPFPLTTNELEARKFSPIWELHALLMDPSYDPNDPNVIIDSAAKIFTSPYVVADVQTNIFLNCPIVPAGTVLDPVPGGPVANEPTVREAFFEGEVINFVPYDIEDGGFNPQILYIFKTPDGQILADDNGIPKIITAKSPGDSFYASIWDVWAVTVPSASAAATITSAKQITNAGVAQFPIHATGIRLNCPVVAINGVAFPFEDAFALLDQLLHQGPSGAFDPNNRKPIGLPESVRTAARTFVITEVTPGSALVPPPPVAAGSLPFPVIDPDDKGNVAPIILDGYPYAVDSSSPTNAPSPTSGPGHLNLIHFTQADLDAAFASLQLPAPIENQISYLINLGLLQSEFGLTGSKTFQQRLALVGRAFGELFWTPEVGGTQRNVTSCQACHSQPTIGAAGRGLYTLRATTDRRGNVNPPSLWGGGPAELLRAQLAAANPSAACASIPAPVPTTTLNGCMTFAHGTLGSIGAMRTVAGNAINAHVGVQAPEVIARQAAAALNAAGPDCAAVASASTTLAKVLAAKNCDLDADTVKNELDTGELTAITVWLANLPVPRQADEDVIINRLGLNPTSVSEGRTTFRRTVDNGGAQCSSCHTVFRPFNSNDPNPTLNITNPETTTAIPVVVDYHTADAEDVADGLATQQGWPGVRIYGDFKLHKMGPNMRNGRPAGTDTSGTNVAVSESTDIMKTAELWDAGAVFPWGRDGRWVGTQLIDTILAHEGVSLNATVSKLRATTKVVGSQTLTTQPVSICGLSSSMPLPIHVVLTGPLSAGLTATNATLPGPDGTFRLGAQWLINSVPSNGCVSLTLNFSSNVATQAQYGLAIQDNNGYSEAVGSIAAFKALSPAQQDKVMAFLRAQLIGGMVGEGSGLIPPPAVK